MKPATSNLANSWGLSRPITKSHAEEWVGMALGYGRSPKFWGTPTVFRQWQKLATSNLVHSLGLPSPIIKSHSDEKVGVALGYEAL